MAGALMACRAARTGAECTPAKGEEAELSVWKGGRSWDGLYEHYRRYGECDDGAVFEGYTEAVATLTTERWDTIGRAGTLVKRDGSFEPFVIKHVKDMDPDRLREVHQNATERCPAGIGALCQQLAEATARSLDVLEPKTR